MASSKNANSTNCFSGIVGRLLCTDSLPTHPSEYITEANTTPQFLHLEKAEPQQVQTVQESPGVVARLMGLESLPKQTTLESFLRSRSVNSVDYLSQFDAYLTTTQHRRVRTSVSFREAPTFLQQLSNDSIVVCLERDQTMNKKENSDVNNHEIKRRAQVIKKKANSEKKQEVCQRNRNLRRASAKPSSKVDKALVLPNPHQKGAQKRSNAATITEKKPVKPMNYSSRVSVNSKSNKRKESKFTAKKSVPECNLEILSSVSSTKVRDITRSIRASSSEAPRLTDLNLRKKISPKRANYNIPCSNTISILNTNNQELTAIATEANKPVMYKEVDYYIKLMANVCRLTEDDIKKSYWIDKQQYVKLEEFEKMCVQLAHYILEQLLNRLVDELVLIYMIKNLAF